MRLKVVGDEIFLLDVLDKEREVVKKILGRRFYRPLKAWVIPANNEAIEDLFKLFGHRFPPVIAQKLRRLQSNANSKEEEVAREKLNERASPIAPIPVKENVKPYNHQVIGFNLALRQFGY